MFFHKIQNISTIFKYFCHLFSDFTNARLPDGLSLFLSFSVIQLIISIAMLSSSLIFPPLEVSNMLSTPSECLVLGTLLKTLEVHLIFSMIPFVSLIKIKEKIWICL